MSAIKYWLWLSTAARLSPKNRAALLEHYGSPEDIYLAPKGELKRLLGDAGGVDVLEKRELDNALFIMEKCEKQGIKVITIQDAQYPDRLKNIYSPPVVLYTKGDMPVVDDEAAIAVIGTRSATPYGIKMAKKLGYEISKCGGIVVSGLTKGIDAAGAEGALMADRPCIGVLGVPHEMAKGRLFNEVSSRGVLISEYPPDTAPYKDFFRARNRITAGLSVGVVVVEAPEKSNTHVFVEDAAELGKEIFAVPGNADAYNCVGTNIMLKNGAVPVTDGWEVLREFEALYPNRIHKCDNMKMPHISGEKDALKKPDTEKTTKKVIDKGEAAEYIDLKKQLESLSETQMKIVSVMDKASVHVDDIIERTGFSTAKVLADLTLLQLKGCVTQEKGKRFTLNIK